MGVWSWGFGVGGLELGVWSSRFKVVIVVRVVSASQRIVFSRKARNEEKTQKTQGITPEG